jgi:hypothetical protein
MSVTPLSATDFPLRAALRLRSDDGTRDAVVSTIGEAATFLRSFPDAQSDTRIEGVLRRLEVAGSDIDKADAGDAFRAWCEEQHLVVEALAPLTSTAKTTPGHRA